MRVNPSASFPDLDLAHPERTRARPMEIAINLRLMETPLKIVTLSRFGGIFE
jgi:hypothetical protein